jgi:hypothetical protein
MLKRNSAGRAVIISDPPRDHQIANPFACLSLPRLPGQTAERCTFADQLDAEEHAKNPYGRR